MTDPTTSHVIFDLEATTSNPDTAKIVQIAALHPAKEPFIAFVDTDTDISDNHQIWSITHIDPETYRQNKRPPSDVYRAFLDFIGDTPLAGHNIYRYDLPLLKRSLAEVRLELPVSHEPPVDTLRWARLRYPTPPADLKSYRLGDLYSFATGFTLEEAHQADKDCEANRDVLRFLFKHPPEPATLAIWRYLGLPEASWYEIGVPDIEMILDALSVNAAVPWIDRPGSPFPAMNDFAPAWFDDVTPDLLEAIANGTASPPDAFPSAQGAAERFFQVAGSYRPSQLKMMRIVAENLAVGGKHLIEAPTGTGKTRGYLYPASPYARGGDGGTTVLIATHTKVLQQQVYGELERLAEHGFNTKAVVVKSARDYVCLDALADLLREAGEADEQERVALALLAGYVRQRGFDLSALPGGWDHQAAFRGVRFNVQTNAHRCRLKCPFVNHCAYQSDLRHRAEADFQVTNQAWLLSNFAGEQDPQDDEEQPPVHLVIDEAHNLESVATEVFSRVTSQEESLFHLRRIYDIKRRKGWLRDNRDVEVAQHSVAAEVRQRLIPTAYAALERYSGQLEEFLKQYGDGDLEYGLSLAMSPEIRMRREWPKLRNAEGAYLEATKALLDALFKFPPTGWLRRNLQTTIDFLRQQRELLYERRNVMRDGDIDEPLPNYIHLTTFDPATGWSHVAQPVDVSSALRQVWNRVESVTLTSATLSVNRKFNYFQRVLGLDDDDVETVSLEETLPYDKAHLVVPTHLPEARTSNLFRFQPLYHRELSEILPKAHRSLTLFTSTKRMREAGRFLEKLPELYLPLTRREREDIAQAMREKPHNAAAALGTRSYMEGVDFPHLKVVNLERIPFPIPDVLLKARQDLAERSGLNPWLDVYLPKALLTFIQAFGRLIRDSRSYAGDGAFVLWDKRLRSASYQLLFRRTLPRGVKVRDAQSRREFYEVLAEILGVDPSVLPTEELRDDALEFIHGLRASDAPLEEKITSLAEYFWEYSELKEKQWEALIASFDRRDVLVLLPTGYGKSLTFQIPAILQGGVTLVVSPLIALMQDQVEQLQQRRLPAAALHSMLTGAEQRSILDEVRDGRVNLLYVSPERVNRSEELKNLLRELAEQGRLTRLVLDEAHCLSEWGHDFRPDYLNVANVLRDLVPDLPISALTATATPIVRDQLCEHLKLSSHVTVSDSHDRPNLSYYTYNLTNDIEKLQRLTQIIRYVQDKHKGHRVIVYASTRRQVGRIAWALGALGFKAAAYHAGLSKIVRNEVRDRFANGTIDVMVATNAFGLGIDLSNVRAVVHFNPPFNLPAYIQEAGRAGRDGNPAFAILLFNGHDWRLAKFITSVSGPEFHHATALLAGLGNAGGRWSGYADALVELVNDQLLDEQFELERSDLNALLIALQESGCLDHRYRVGKIFLLCEDTKPLEPYLDDLRKHGFEGRIEGDELDLSTMPTDQVESLNDFLYSLFKQRKILLYANREPAIELSDMRLTGIHPYTQRQTKLKNQAKKRLQEMRDYAEVSTCKRAFLLAAFEQVPERCNTCGSCDQLALEAGPLSEPWLEQAPFDQKLLESVYKPFDTMLEFLEQHRVASLQYETYLGLGETKIVMALRGVSHQFLGSQSSLVKLGRREQDNPMFGHLAFITEKEIKRSLQRAMQQRLVETRPFQDSKTYLITEAGREYLADLQRRRIRRLPA